MLAVLLRKQIIIQKLMKLKKKLTDHDHDKCIMFLMQDWHKQI